MSLRHLSLPLGLLLYFTTNARAALPYNPVRIFQSTTKNGKAIYYVLNPSSAPSSAGELSVLNIDSTLSNTALSFGWSVSVPPLQYIGALQPYTALSQSDGSIALYTGNCSDPSPQSALWQFTPHTDTDDGSGSWAQVSVTSPSSGSYPASGAHWLASGISFSYNASLPDNVHVFGGMCPYYNTTTTSWQSDASYSNQLITLDWQSTSIYSLTSSAGQPTPEAGVTITPLAPTYSNQGDGSTIQQQDFVLIGGHTQNAFIGMDQVALFSLPQESWTFQTVGQTSGVDLARRQEATMEPRSGHTAVLSEDGTKIVVFGGWVGDVQTPATPQLSVLNIGGGYGGSGDWSWTTLTAVPFAEGAGIYGHGAVMLPGDIMLVTGGYSIPPSSNGKMRRAIQSTNGQNYFFNTSSGAWIDSYDGNAATASIPAGNQATGALHTATQKAGLGVGLAVGLIALIGILVFTFWYYRNLRRRREDNDAEPWEDREKEINDLSTVITNPSRNGIEDGGGSLDAGTVWTAEELANRSAYPWVCGSDNDASVRTAARSGVFVDIPSPQRGLRRSMYSRGQYQSAPRFDDERRLYGSGAMSAIQEEEGSNASNSRQGSSKRRRSLSVDTEAANLDPFRDPDPPGPTPPSATIRRVPVPARIPGTHERPASPAEERQREMSGWVRDWEAASQLPHSPSAAAARYSPTKSGRSSPSKSERTRSDLSERSTRSTGVPIPSRGPSTSSVIRSYLPSILPAALTSPFGPSTAATSPTRDRAGEENMYGSSSSGNSQNSGSDRANSFNTARTTISQLQAESEALLGHVSSHRLSNSHVSPRGNSFSVASAIAHPRGTRTADLIPDVEPTFTLPRARTTQQVSFTPHSREPPGRSRHSSFVGTWVGSVKRNVRALAGGRTVSLTSDADLTARPGGIGSDGYYEYGMRPEPTLFASAEAAHSRHKKSDLGGLVDLSVADDWGSYPPISGRAGKKEPPRRSVSEGGATFWKPKRGARDWDVEPIPKAVNLRNRSLIPRPLSSVSSTGKSALETVGTASPASPSVDDRSSSNRPNPLRRTGESANATGELPSPVGLEANTTANASAVSINSNNYGRGVNADGDDWDVEAAIEQRVVQVMFTVPRERLRVVNADPDSLSLGSSAGVGGVLERGVVGGRVDGGSSAFVDGAGDGDVFGLGRGEDGGDVVSEKGKGKGRVF